MNLKYIEDYYEQVHERFPDLEMWEIEKILKHGMRSLYMINSKGGDVLIRSSNSSIVMYFGKLFMNKEMFLKYRDLKWRIKYRIKYWVKKPVFDGNYYFGLTQEEYDKYVPKKKGRVKNKVVFEHIHAFKIKDECMLNTKHKYFFKLFNMEDGKMTIREDNYATRNFELIAKRNKDGKIEYING